MGQERASKMLSAASEQNVADALVVFKFFKEHANQSETTELSDDAIPLARRLVQLLGGKPTEPTEDTLGFGFLDKFFAQQTCQALGFPAQRRLQRLCGR